MLFKSSYYNIFYEINDDTWIFNSFNLGLTAVPSNVLDVLKEDVIDLDYYSGDIHDTLEELVDAGILVNVAVNELEILQYIYNTDKYNKDYLSVTILPTLECNCSCFYCFERENKIKTKETRNVDVDFDDIEDYILNFIETKLSDTKNLNIAWFGGEPLLSFDIIERLSEKLIALAKKYDVTYTASITTNGYFISEIPNVINRFKKCRISSYQITLDGSPKEHNNARKLKSKNSETFNKMLEGIVFLHKNDLAVSIRVNLNKLNVPTINELFDILEENGLKSVKIYFGHLIDYSDNDNSHIYFDESEYADIVSKLYTELRKRKFKYGLDDHYPFNARPCIANRIDSAVIDCYGNIYKCRSQIGEYEKIIGNVYNIGEQTELEAMREINWIEWSPFKYSVCRECRILPLCMGGCPYGLYEDDNAQPKCVEWKFNIDFFIKQKIINSEVRLNGET